MTQKIRQLMLLLGDALLMYVSLFLALSLRNQAIISPEIWSQHWPVFSYAFAIWILAFYIAGSYTISNIRNDLRFYINAIRVMGIDILLAVSFFYVLPQTQLTPKTILVLTGIIFFLLFIGWRQLAHRTILKKALRQKVLITGKNQTVLELARLLDRNPQYGYDLSAIMAHNAKDEIGNVPDYTDSEQLENIIDKHKISLIVMDHESRESKKLINNLYKHLNRRLEFMSLDEFYESITKRVPLEIIDQFWFLENLQEGRKRFYDFGKRMVDIVASIVFGIIFLALSPLIGILIILTSGFPILFIQTRIGKNGRPFRAVKFRTMVRDAEKNGPQWAAKDDPRVTAIGKFLRKSRVDEIPQLINILRGEMSFVGPRPERPEFVDKLKQEIPFYRERLLVKPGLTGWAQINYRYGASVQDAKTKLQYDLYYVKNRSLALDFGIILRTVKTVLSAIGQ